jgi:nucleoid-associated protein YgaU
MHMFKGRTILSLIVIPLALVLLAGCSRHTPREIDISKGEYYEDEEYQKLSKKEREAYCVELAAELDALQKRSEESEAQLERNKEEIQTLTRDLRDAEREYSRLNNSVDELTMQLQELATLPKEWLLQYGECLWIVAGYEEIYGDPLKWTRLWRGNVQMIEDPDWVLAGWTIQVPREWPTKHLVRQDEWLAKIAGYWEVYDNYRQWPILFEANKDRVADPDLIFPEQELVIPREYPASD